MQYSGFSQGSFLLSLVFHLSWLMSHTAYGKGEQQAHALDTRSQPKGKMLECARHGGFLKIEDPLLLSRMVVPFERTQVIVPEYPHLLLWQEMVWYRARAWGLSLGVIRQNCSRVVGPSCPVLPFPITPDQ